MTKAITIRFILLTLILAVAACNSENKTVSGNDVLSQGSFVLSKTELQNKIKGGWAGQTIGVVYGAPVEFKYQGSLIDDQLNIPWNEHYVKYWWDKKPGYLYRFKFRKSF